MPLSIPLAMASAPDAIPIPTLARFTLTSPVSTVVRASAPA